MVGCAQTEGMVRTTLRRLLKLAILGGLVALVVTWFRRRDPQVVESEIPGAARWTPLEAPDEPPSVIAEPTDGAAAEAQAAGWIEPDPEGDCPISHPVKVKLKSGIYHVPDGLSYERTNADRCYLSPEAAEADGYRASKM